MILRRTGVAAERHVGQDTVIRTSDKTKDDTTSFDNFSQSFI